MGGVKVFHKNPEVVAKIINGLKKYFGNLPITRKNNHNFLGIKIEVRNDKTIAISVKDHILEAISTWSEEINCIATSPTKKGLCTVDEIVNKLGTIQAKVFYSIVYKLLWVMK